LIIVIKKKMVPQGYSS
jgi:hypothetical protein